MAAVDVARLRAGIMGQVHLDGKLDEATWQAVDSSDGFRQVEPSEGAAPSTRTVIRVVAEPASLIIGIRADEVSVQFAPVAPEACPALVLNADYRPLSYYPLSLWSW